MPAAKPRLPNLYDSIDYRAYLRGWFKARKAADPGFSWTVFARKAGLASRGHARNVAAGVLNLGPAGIDAFARGLGLSEKEREFFRLLVACTQAPGGQVRETRLGELRYWLWEHLRRKLSEGENRKILSRPSRFLVYLLTCQRGFRADPVWISRQLRGKIRPGEAREALRFLRGSGFIRISGKRLLGTSAGSTLFSFSDGQPSDRPWSRWVLSAAADPSRRSIENLYSVHAILTEEEAREIAARLKRQAVEAVPDRPSRRVRGRLYLLVGDLLPLSGS